jgi:hypothetical protein
MPFARTQSERVRPIDFLVYNAKLTDQTCMHWQTQCGSFQWVVFLDVPRVVPPTSHDSASQNESIHLSFFQSLVQAALEILHIQSDPEI